MRSGVGLAGALGFGVRAEGFRFRVEGVGCRVGLGSSPGRGIVARRERI